MFSKFSLQVINALSVKFPETYFVGGAVRNILLNKKITDSDIATSARPEQVCALLKSSKISFSDEHKKMGVVIAKKAGETIEIATFRKEEYGKSRFPKVIFITDSRVDSDRRDFTGNALYYSPITKELLDFHGGLKDLALHKLKFIGNVKKKITEDPVRIIRAYKYSAQYNLKIDTLTHNILQKNIHLLKQLSSQRLQKEIESVTSQKIKKELQKVIHSNA